MERLIFGGEEAGQGDLYVSQVIVLPAPLELTVSYGSGTGAGPAAILDASRQVELFDEERGARYWPVGAVHSLAPVRLSRQPERCVEAIAAAAAPHFERKKFVLAFGGEHTITAGTVREAVQAYPELGVLIFDAHLDLRAEYEGSPWSHACVARRILEAHGVQIEWCGIRSVAEEEAEFVRERGLRPLYTHEADATGSWIREIAGRLPEHVYLSIDIDGLDPAYAPGTGTPEPGGHSYRELLALIREVVATRKVVGADIVEVAPIPGQHLTEFTAAKVAAKLIGGVIRK
ncbi:MAG: agmatinase [Planctomycetes bacterium]|nr:agmatinase [Planctomycetota bacterium]